MGWKQSVAVADVILYCVYGILKKKNKPIKTIITSFAKLLRHFRAKLKKKSLNVFWSQLGQSKQTKSQTIKLVLALIQLGT